MWVTVQVLACMGMWWSCGVCMMYECVVRDDHSGDLSVRVVRVGYIWLSGGRVGYVWVRDDRSYGVCVGEW